MEPRTGPTPRTHRQRFVTGKVLSKPDLLHDD